MPFQFSGGISPMAKSWTFAAHSARMSACVLGHIHRVHQSMSITAVPISMVRVRALIAAGEGNGRSI